MAPVVLHPHACKYCEKIVVDRSSQPPSRLRSGPGNDTAAQRKLLFDFTLGYLVEAGTNSCHLCSWILDEQCISLKPAPPWCSAQKDGEPSKESADIASDRPSLRPFSPQETIRGMATRTPEDLENLCLVVGADDGANVFRIDFFGL